MFATLNSPLLCFESLTNVEYNHVPYATLKISETELFPTVIRYYSNRSRERPPDLVKTRVSPGRCNLQCIVGRDLETNQRGSC